MNQELTPKQQAVELIKQASHILLVSGKQLNNDQLSAMVALELILKRAGKNVSAIATGELPKVAKILDTKVISRDLTGIRDFIVRLDTSKVEVDKLRYEVNEDNLEVIVSPFAGNFTADDATFDYGAYKFDLVIVLGVSQISKIDSILEENPTIFDGLHLINIDSHRSNELYGSVNYVESQAGSVCEMLVGVIESVAQGMIDYHVATALLAGIMGATQGFTGPNTTAKSLTIAAQMMSAGAKQQEIVQTLFTHNNNSQNHTNKREINKPKANVFEKNSQKTETVAEKLKKQGIELSQEGLVENKSQEIIKQEVLEDETSSEAKEFEDKKSLKKFKDKKSLKKFKNPRPEK